MIEADNPLYQLHRAVDALATGTGTIQHRLIIVYSPMLESLRLETVPSDVQKDLQRVQAAISAAMKTSDSDVYGNATLSSMDDEQASELAETILRIFMKIAQRDPDYVYRKRPEMKVRANSREGLPVNHRQR